MLWSFVLEGFGLLGAFLVGRRLWWAWAFLAVNSALWAVYGWETDQLGFCFAGLVYAPVYLRNLYSWRKSDKGKL